jgi:hypothetical protein
MKQWRIAFATDCCRVLFSAVLCYEQKLQNNKRTIADTTVTSIITTYQNRVSENSYVATATWTRDTGGQWCA